MTFLWNQDSGDSGAVQLETLSTVSLERTSNVQNQAEPVCRLPILNLMF
jgi:hypothetical protein